jgi:hypothetical protein
MFKLFFNKSHLLDTYYHKGLTEFLGLKFIFFWQTYVFVLSLFANVIIIIYKDFRI